MLDCFMGHWAWRDMMSPGLKKSLNKPVEVHVTVTGWKWMTAMVTLGRSA